MRRQNIFNLLRRNLSSSSSSARIVHRDRKLFMIESDPTAPLSHLEPGKKIIIGERTDGVVLFQRSGFYFATSTNNEDDHIQLTGEDYNIRISMNNTHIDSTGKTYDDLEETAVVVPWMRIQPQQMERQVIWEWLPTGLIMMDSLTPMGRGQSMLLVSKNMSTTRDMKRIMNNVSTAQTRFDTKIFRVHAKLNSSSLLEENDHDVENVDVVVNAVAAAADDDDDTDVSALLAAHTACTVGENKRDEKKLENNHVIVFLDDMTPLRRLWKRAGDMIATFRGTSCNESSIMEDLTEMRHYYSPLLQRAACMSSSKGGGTMSILASMPYEENKEEDNGIEIELDENNMPASVRERLSLIRDRGIELNAETLRKIGLEMYIPKSVKNHSLRHCEELKSICDGHVEVLQDSDRILCPASSLTRIGMATKSGKDIKDVRPPALQSMARGLRVRLIAMMEDPHPISKAESNALLNAMSQGDTLTSLVDQVILLYAATSGHFVEGITTWDSHLTGGANSSVLKHVKSCAPETVRNIQDTLEFSESSRMELDVCLRLYKAIHSSNSSSSRSVVDDDCGGGSGGGGEQNLS